MKKETKHLNSEEVSAENGKAQGKKKNKVLSTVINVILVIAIILAAMCTYVSFVTSSGNGVPGIFGIQFFSVQTESMSPTLEPGDLVIATSIKDFTQLKKGAYNKDDPSAGGDIITYWTIINGEKVLNTHRIIDIYDGGDHLIFSTQGDNNSSRDPLTVHQTYVVGKYSFKISGLGKVFDFLQTSTGFLLIVVLPVLLFFIYHLVQFFRVFFEYQNIKNRLKYEQERGATEDILEDERRKNAEEKEKSRADIEAELREKLKAELMAEMAKQAKSEAVSEPENVENANTDEAPEDK